MNSDGDSWEAHDQNSLRPRSEQFSEEVDFQNHFVIKKTPGEPRKVDVINQNSESSAKSLKVVWESGKILNPHVSQTQFSNTIIDIDPTPSLRVPNDFEGKPNVASLIAKFNQAAAIDCKSHKNKLPPVRRGPPRLPPRFSVSGDENSKPFKELQTTEKVNEETVKDGINKEVPLGGQEGDKSQKIIQLDNIIHKYFPLQDKTKSSDAITSTHHPSIANSAVASLHPHCMLDEHKQQKLKQRRHSKEDKSNRLIPEATINKPKPKPLCPFRIDKQAQKNTSCPSNLIFGGGNKAAKPHLFGLLVSPYIDMSSFKDFPPASPHSGLASLRSSTTTVSSPMDPNYLPIRNYLETEKLKLIRMEDIDISLGASEKEVLAICEQRAPIPINCVFQEMKLLHKVGEGVFGEVFLGQFNGRGRVYKVVPIEGKAKVNGEKQKTFNEIFPEIAISKQLSKLSSDDQHDAYRGNFTDGYIKLYNTRLAKGDYPEILVNTWKTWDERHSSDNDCPDFPAKQLYIIFEFEYGGRDAEAFVFRNSRQAFCLTLQIAHTLAVGEASMEFEHRDLHWGNILVRDTESATINFEINGKSLLVPSGGIKGCIIDFTIARVVNDQQSPVFVDLKDDEEQFLGTGDHQFDIYRMMRDCNRNEWAPFCPKTNTYWIHYLADKLLSKGRYLETDSLDHLFFLKQLQALKSAIMRHDSCQQFIFHKSCEDFKTVEPSKMSATRYSSGGGGAPKIKIRKAKGVGGGTRAQS